MQVFECRDIGRIVIAAKISDPKQYKALDLNFYILKKKK